MERSVVILIFVDWMINHVLGLSMSVYYEALCPDSIDFLINQLRPNYQYFKDINIELVPYGKASHTEDRGSYIFECQHGELECFGNKQQACALSQNNGQDKDVEFITCVMGQYNPTGASSIQYCGRKSGINWSDVIRCSTSKEGDELLAKNGDKTVELDPVITFVPTIIFNNSYNQTLQDRAMYNLRDVLCDIKGGEKEICSPKKTSRDLAYDWYY